MWPSPPDETLRLYGDLLARPPIAATAGELLDLWQVDVVRFVCVRPELMDDHPELPMRIRGAFGRRLAEIDAPIDWRGRPGPRAWQILFEPLARFAPGREVPRPFVVHAWREGDGLIVDLGLFGFAAICLDDAVRAMLAALAGGVALRGDGAARVPITVEDVLHRRRLPDPPPDTGSATLTFWTPVVVRHGGRLVDDARSILRSAPRRVAALAPFQSCRFVPDDDLSERIDALVLDETDLVPYRWQRHSRRRGDAPIPMHGYLGRLGISGAFGALATLLVLAETCNLGSHAGLGTGWFDLALYPRPR